MIVPVESPERESEPDVVVAVDEAGMLLVVIDTRGGETAAVVAVVADAEDG